MFELQDYLDVVPLPVLVLAPVLAGMAFMFCPSRIRLPIALTILPPFLLVGRLPMLGPPALAAKALGFAMLLAVAAAAIASPGRKRKLPPIAYGYLPLALVGPVFLVTAEDNTFPLLLSVQWICMVLATLAVTRTIVDRDSLMLVLVSLATGFTLSMPIMLSALVTGNWTFTGHSRFEPYGASSLQVGIIFTIAAGLGLYLALRGRFWPLRLIWLGTAAVSAGLGLLSGTRSVMITMVGVCAPLGFYMIRRPVLAIPMIAMMLVGVAVIISRVDANPFHRYQTVETARGEQAVTYIRESISQRPMTGLLGTSGLRAESDEDLGYHAHNAYLKMAYTGGIVLLAPYLVLAFVSCLAAFLVWKNRALFDVDPLLMSVLFAFLLMVYAHGMVNHMIYLATNSWAFMHLLLSMLFMSWAGEMLRFKRDNPAMATMLLSQPRLAT
ncbi:MAG: hypothetical protein AAFX79_10035 [Planctomycetota bacterium]